MALRHATTSERGDALDSERSAAAGAAAPAVGLAGVRKSYGAVVAVDGVDLDVRPGEFFTLLGPSGSGKTTTLRLVAGFERPDAGRIELAGADVTRRAPFERDVNTVFQDYALFPHMNVRDNVGYGLRVKGLGRRERNARVEELLRLVRLPGLGDRKPVQLSGGQRQRVALARALVNSPSVLLLDEPLGALDLKLRQEMQLELKRIQREVSEVGMTFLYVTHDQEEALTMSDRLAVFNEGRIEQVGSPADVYERPRSEFVAGFVGTSNVLERGGRRFTIRPEKLRLVEPAAPEDRRLCSERGTIVDAVYVGAVTRYRVELSAGGELTVMRQNLETTSSDALEERGRAVRVEWRPEQAYEIPEEEEGSARYP